MHHGVPGSPARDGTALRLYIGCPADTGIVFENNRGLFPILFSLMPCVQLTLEERYVIYPLKLFKLSLREIARRLGRPHTTISREIQRNESVIVTPLILLKLAVATVPIQ